jgi:hypothetical protein
LRPRGPRARPYTSSSGVAVLPSLTGSSRWQGSKAGSKATMMVVDGFPEPEGGAYEDPCHPDRAVQGLPDRAKPTGQLNPTTRKPASPFLFFPSPPHTHTLESRLPHSHGSRARVPGSRVTWCCCWRSGGPGWNWSRSVGAWAGSLRRPARLSFSLHFFFYRPRPCPPHCLSLLCRRQIHVYLAGFVGVHTLHQVKVAISLSVRTHPRNSLSLSLHLRNRT